MFKITGRRGFHITFQNGWTASVQFGPGNYCSARDAPFDAPKNVENWECDNAEVAAFPAPNGDLVDLGNNSVKGWLNANQVLAFLNWVAGDKRDPADLDRALASAEAPHA